MAVTVGERLGFPVVLRPEGAGATGDLAWQSCGNFGRSIGLACRRANAFVSISDSIKQELQEAWYRGTMRPSGSMMTSAETPKPPRIVSIPNGVPIPAIFLATSTRMADSSSCSLHRSPCIRKGIGYADRGLAKGAIRFPEAQLILIGDGSERARS